MLVEAGRSARVAAPLDRDVRRVESALDALGVHEVEGELQTAVALAVDRLSGLEGARVVVLTDAHLAHPLELSGGAVPVETIEVGDELDNAAIVRADVRLGTDRATGREEVQAFALVSNQGASARELYVTLRRDGEVDPVDSRRIVLAPGEKSPVALGFAPTREDAGRGLVFEIAPHDALEVDDRAFGRVPAGGKLPVVLASAKSEPSTWFARAFEADRGVELARVDVAQLSDPVRVPDDALVVIEGACPSIASGRRWIIVDPPEGDCQGVRVGARVERPSITSWTTSDPRLRFLSLDGLSIAQARALEPAAPSGSLVRSSSAVLVADASTEARSITVVGFDVGDSDWPLKASFVLFARNAVEAARLTRQSVASGAQSPGEPLRVEVGVGVERASVTRPDGVREELAARGGWVVVPDTRRCGLYTIEPGGSAAPSPSEPVASSKARRVVVPVSLASEAESNLRGRSAITQAGAPVPRAANELPPQRRDWAWLAAAVALALVVGEVFVATRNMRVRIATPPRAPERRGA